MQQLNNYISELSNYLVELDDEIKQTADLLNSENRKENAPALETFKTLISQIKNLETALSSINAKFQKSREKCEMHITNYKNKLLDEIKTVELWADVPEDEPAKPEPEVSANTEKFSEKAAKPVPEGVLFKSINKVFGETLWYNMQVPIRKVNLCSKEHEAVTISLVSVKNDKELYSLPPGMLVFHSGRKVPKIILTTGMTSSPYVPLGCRVWSPDDNDTHIKYSRYMAKVANEGTPSAELFYIDETLAQKMKIPEDRSRVFRYPQKVKSDKPAWNGYYVHKVPNFGDSADLKNQITEISLNDTVDIYQQSLWTALISIAHYNSRVKKFEA